MGASNLWFPFTISTLAIPTEAARTSILALTNVTTPVAVQLANQGFKAAIQQDSTLARGVNTYQGYVVHQGVASSLGYEMKALEKLI